MARKLVFVHGRAQQHKDSLALKQEWIDAWRSGLDAAGLEMPVTAADIRFPYYGDALDQLAGGADPATAAAVIIRGNELDAEEKRFANAIALHIQEKFISRDQMAAVAGREVVERGPLQWEWFQGVLQAVDRYVPGASAASIALATHDVYQYLRNEAVRDILDDGVMQAMQSDVETVVVSHSLGTVMAYRVLRQFGQARGWRVPQFVTLGSPLSVKSTGMCICVATGCPSTRSGVACQCWAAASTAFLNTSSTGQRLDRRCTVMSVRLPSGCTVASSMTNACWCARAASVG